MLKMKEPWEPCDNLCFIFLWLVVFEWLIQMWIVKDSVTLWIIHVKFIKVKTKNKATEGFNAFVVYDTVAFMTYDLHMPLVSLPTSQSMLASIILVYPFSGRPDLKGSGQELEAGYSVNRPLRPFLGFVLVLVFFAFMFFVCFGLICVFFNPDKIFGKLRQSKFIVINSTTTIGDCVSVSILKWQIFFTLHMSVVFSHFWHSYC